MVFRKFISNKNEKKTVIKANMPVYLGLAILSLSWTIGMMIWNRNIVII